MSHIITSTEKYRPLAEEVIVRMEYGDTYNGKPVSAARLKQENPEKFLQLIVDHYSPYEKTVFPDKEIYHRFVKFDEMAGKNVVLIGGTVDNDETMELYDLGTTIVEQAHSLTIVIPYLGYATMERRTKPGEVVKAAKRAHLLKSIPNAEIKNTFIFFDLHTEGIPYYFGEDCRKFHVYTKPLVMEACEEIQPDGDFILGSVDTGRTKWIESLAADMSVKFKKPIKIAIISKERKSGTETHITGYEGADPKGKVVIIYDDMVRTGGSVLKAAKAYREMGAKAVHMITTHGVFPDVVLPNAEAFGLEEKFKVPSSVLLAGPVDGRLDSLYVTDTHCNAGTWAKESLFPGEDRVHVKSIAGLIVNTIKNKTEF